VRFVILGAGAIGGVVGARLSQAGHDVELIARGAHRDAIRERGLAIEDPAARAVLRLPVTDDPAAIDFSEDPVVLLCTKSQDTEEAVRALAASAPAATAIVCMQNGVENERVALRRFANVYGAVVMVPAAHLEPGVVQAYGSRLTGMIEVGRYPSGLDDRAEHVARALQSATFSASAREDVMRLKYSKLVLNLANVLDAICAPGPAADELGERAKDEAREVLRAAGIAFEAGDVADVKARWERMGVRAIDGRERAGSSSWQSLARGTGSIETDYLNGEIALLGRMHGVPTPVNAALCQLASRAARTGAAPARLAAEDLLTRLNEPDILVQWTS
jgi:2-dehydropantoate 2-reductase